jgi:intergrase/recombinase
MTDNTKETLMPTDSETKETVTLDRLNEDDVQLVYEEAVERGFSFAAFLSDLQLVLRTPQETKEPEQTTEAVIEKLTGFAEYYEEKLAKGDWNAFQSRDQVEGCGQGVRGAIRLLEGDIR